MYKLVKAKYRHYNTHIYRLEGINYEHIREHIFKIVSH